MGKHAYQKAGAQTLKYYCGAVHDSTWHQNCGHLVAALERLDKEDVTLQNVSIDFSTANPECQVRCVVEWKRWNVVVASQPEAQETQF